MAGFEVKLVCDGQAALDDAMSSAYDLMTVDLNMPSLDGLSLIESVVSQEGPNQKTPIVVISAYLSPETEDTLREHGIVDCLTKPFEAERLGELANRVIK